MNRKNLRERLDASLTRAKEELGRLPFEYSEEAWRRRKEIMEQVRGLTEMRTLFATVPTPHAEDKVWREILY